MPYYDPAGSYVLCSSIYLLSLGLVVFGAAHMVEIMQHLRVSLKRPVIDDNPNIIELLKEISAIKIL